MSSGFTFGDNSEYFSNFDFLSDHSISDTVLSTRTLEQAILCSACSEQTSGIRLCTHIRNALR